MVGLKLVVINFLCTVKSSAFAMAVSLSKQLMSASTYDFNPFSFSIYLAIVHSLMTITNVCPSEKFIASFRISSESIAGQTQSKYVSLNSSLKN